MRWSLVLIPLGSIIVSCCSIDYPSRVERADRTVISFLIKYVEAQVSAFEKTRVFDAELVPGSSSAGWTNITSGYAAVKARQYGCDFNVQTSRFQVVCSPSDDSRLRISFYVDETRIIRLSADHPAGPSSPALRLTPQEEHSLFREVAGTRNGTKRP